VLEDDSCPIAVQIDDGIATIDCPAGRENYGSSVPLVKGTAEISALEEGQSLWLVAWTGAPVGAGEAAYLADELATDLWESSNVVIAAPDEPPGLAELRIYVLTSTQLEIATRRLASGDPAGAYLIDEELDMTPQDRVQVTRNALPPLSAPC
jgi:hypothetical protein